MPLQLDTGSTNVTMFFAYSIAALRTFLVESSKRFCLALARKKVASQIYSDNCERLPPIFIFHPHVVISL